MVYFEAVATANANEYTFVSAESARDVKTIGAFAPAIIAPTFASAKYTSDLYSTFPASIVGTSKISALPATSLTMPLCSPQFVILHYLKQVFINDTIFNLSA